MFCALVYCSGVLVRIVVLVFLVIGAVSSCTPPDRITPKSAQEDNFLLPPEHWPVTVNAAISDVMSLMSAEARDELRRTKREDLIHFHFGLGLGIRNRYGLWRGNIKLIEAACGKPCHPDEASFIIIEAVWKKLQE